MFPFRFRRLRFAGAVLASSVLVGSASTLGVLTASAAPVASCGEPVLSLANPNPGDMLMPGGYQIDGVAFDPMSAQPLQSSGISDVSIFLDSRDSGGVNLGTTSTGYVPSFAPADEDAAPMTPNAGAFRLVVTLPSNVVGEHDIVAYARSSLTGQETVVSVPVLLGQDPSKTGVDVTTLSESNSNPGTAPVNCSTPTAATSVPTTSQALASNALTLQLANPNPGDTVGSGANVISGVAFDPSSTTGSGIDRISFFLGDRNQGGIDILDITPTSNQFTTTLTLPTSHLGFQTLFVYAHSSVTGAETSLAVPITIAQ